MRTATKRPSLFQEGDVAAVDPKIQRLLDICGIKELPPVHTLTVPLDRITIIPGGELAKPSARFIRSIETVGIRQPPSIAWCQGTAWDADDAIYEVVMGRRRVLAARHLHFRGHSRFQTIKCEVYERSIPRLNAFLGLIENDHRSDAWIQDIIRLRLLIREGVAMTLDDLAEYGFNRKTVKGRLDIALLPDVILDQICAGMVSQDGAMQVTRLTQTQRGRLQTLLAEGEELTAELVKSLLKRQVNQGLAAVHTNLSQMWTTLANESQVAPTVLSSSEAPQPHVPDSPLDVSHLLMVLRQFEPQTRADTALQRAGTLIGVLIKELEIVQRSQPLSRQEGELTHV